MADKRKPTSKNRQDLRLTQEIPRTPSQVRPNQNTGKARRKKRKKRGCIYSLILLFAAIFIVLSLTVLFRCEKIMVTGDSDYTQEEIIHASGLKLDKNIFLSDRNSAKTLIESKLPLVEDARISIRFPNALEIHVTKAVPAAALKYENQYIMLSRKGKVLKIQASMPNDIPVVSGLSIKEVQEGKHIQYERKEAGEILSSLIQQWGEQQTGLSMTEIHFTESLGISLKFDNRLNVQIGTYLDMDTKISFAGSIIKEHLPKDFKGTIKFSSDGKKAYVRPDYGSPSVVILPEDGKSSDTASQNTQNSSEESKPQQE